MKLVCMSDTHGKHRQLQVPEGDILIHAGDICLAFGGSGKQLLNQILDFDAWLGTLPHKHKIVIAGNHDFPFLAGKREAQCLLSNAVYLQDSGITIEGLNIWGSPWQPWHHDFAFNLREEIAEKWALIPEDTHVLVTHSPPFNVCDGPRPIGCPALLERVRAVAPFLHIFGHSHLGWGNAKQGDTTFLNVAIANNKYAVRAAPTVIELG
jgi:Icc-related predicted phosphoesterase